MHLNMRLLRCCAVGTRGRRERERGIEEDEANWKEEGHDLVFSGLHIIEEEKETASFLKRSAKPLLSFSL